MPSISAALFWTATVVSTIDSITIPITRHTLCLLLAQRIRRLLHNHCHVAETARVLGIRHLTVAVAGFDLGFDLLNDGAVACCVDLLANPLGRPAKAIADRRMRISRLLEADRD